jgi:hypothetical protein
MNRRTLQMTLVVMSALFYIGCGCGSHLKVEITQAPSTLQVNTSSPVTATVTHDHAAGGVNWSCTPVGTCGSFDPTQTASGVASTYTAPAAAGTVTIIATSVDKPSVSASVSVSVTVPTVTTSNFSFYAIGEEAAQDTFDVYSLAGSVAIATVASGDGSFAVVSGEQDYNDGDIITSPQPTGDAITGGSLVVEANGQAILTLITNNANVGADGTETLSLVYVNANHAMITEFDGGGTSSGSLDLQTLPSTLAGGYSFNLSGAGSDFEPVALGGVFTISGTSINNGAFDLNDAGSITFDTAFTGSISAPDSFGRGVITGTGIAVTINYYVVGPEAIRIIDVDGTDTAVGSAYGQGDSAGSFGNGSLTQSAFGMSGSSSSNLYASAGEIESGGGGALPRGPHGEGIPTSGFIGVADVAEPFSSIVVQAGLLSGDYFVESDGYGGLEITNESLGDVSLLGIYAVDPTLNIMDPNNPAGGGGGFLIADLDSSIIGTGVLIPQTDTTTTDFSGNYSLGFQGFGFDEYDAVGQGSVTDSGVLTGTGTVNDPFGDLTTAGQDVAAFTGTAVPDGSNLGRFTMAAGVAVAGNTATPFTTALYQASGQYVFWMNEDPDFLSVWFGSFQQQAPESDAKKAAAKRKAKH